MALINQQGFIFIHIYKCAGRTIRNIIYNETPVQELNMGHATAQQIRNHCFSQSGGEWFWNNAFKFSFIRNPFDWVVSIYHFIKENPEHENYSQVKDFTFDQFVEWNAYMVKGGVENSTGSFNTLSGFLCDDNGAGKLIVDFVGRMENIDEDLKTVCNHTGIKLPNDLPKLNKSKRESDYRKYYSEHTRNIVADVYYNDLNKFNYSF